MDEFLRRCRCVSALEEAARRFQELKAQRESREALEQERNSRKPPPYKFIKVMLRQYHTQPQNMYHI